MNHALTPRDVDLLQAAFHAHADASAAWQRWRDGVDWGGPIDPVGFSLLPRVCRNLEAIGVADPLFPRFKGIARQTWVANQRRKASIGEWASALPSVEFMALPPTSALFLDSTSMRSHGRWYHLAVHPEQAVFTIHTLLHGGWRIKGLRLPNSLISGYVLGCGHIPLERPDGDSLTVAWRLEHWFGTGAEEVWTDSASVALGMRSIRCVSQADALVFMLRQPVGGDPLRWVSNVLSLSSPTVDWPRVLRSLAMQPLAHDCAALLPTVCRFIDGGHSTASSWQWPVASADRVPVTPPMGSCWSRFRQDWARYKAAWGSEYRLGSAIAQLPGYLMARWRMTSLAGLPQGLARWV